jgi:alpha-beta hydrolase superfamily lysophospholipase
MGFFRFDHRGCGNSEGEFAAVTTFDGRCLDLNSAMDLIVARPDTGDAVALFGSSFGGAVVLAVAAEREVCAVVTVAAPVCLGTIRPPNIDDPEEAFRLRGLDRERLDFDITDRLGRVRNLLSFHGDQDTVVPFSNALAIHEKAGLPKVLVRHENGDHSMSNPGHQRDFLKRSIDWYREGFGIATS